MNLRKFITLCLPIALLAISGCASHEARMTKQPLPEWIQISSEGFYGSHWLFIDYRTNPPSIRLNDGRQTFWTNQFPEAANRLRDFDVGIVPKTVKGRRWGGGYDVGTKTIVYHFKDSEVRIFRDYRMKRPLDGNFKKLQKLVEALEYEVGTLQNREIDRLNRLSTKPY